MTLYARVAALAVCLVAAVTAACGQTSLSPTSPSVASGGPMVRGGSTSGAVITGTVNGGTQSTTSSETFAARATTTPVTVTVVGTTISAVADGKGKFSLTGVPAGDVQLKFAGVGVDATITLFGVEAGDRIDLVVRVTGSSVRIEAERRERRNRDDDDDDEDDDDGDDDEDDDDDRDSSTTELEGVASALSGTCPDISFTLRGLTVKANSATRYEDGTCAGVTNNIELEVKGQRQADGSVLATRIELED